MESKAHVQLLIDIDTLKSTYLLSLLIFTMRNDMSTTFLQQILSGRLLLVVIVGAKI